MRRVFALFLSLSILLALSACSRFPQGTRVACGEIAVSLELPPCWSYEPQSGYHQGVRFWPEEEPSCVFTLTQWSDPHAGITCGTGYLQGYRTYENGETMAYCWLSENGWIDLNLYWPYWENYRVLGRITSEQWEAYQDAVDRICATVSFSE